MDFNPVWSSSAHARGESWPFSSYPGMLRTIGGLGPDLDFDECCLCFDELIKASRDARRRMVKKLWEEKYGSGTHDIFPLMRLMLPHLDSERPNYFLKQNKLAHIYIENLGLNERQKEAQVRTPVQ